jgi:N,N'-diacetylchitobiose transport system substrate-binding protein
VEIGNTLTAGFAAEGGLKELTDKKGDLGGDDWNKGLEESSTVDGKLFAAPYYAGTRQLLYRKDLFTAAGITAPPTTVDELIAAGAKLKAKNPAKDFSSLACPGKNWYFGVSFVYGNGGALAVSEGGQWKGALDSPEAVKGLEQYKALCDGLSTYPKDVTEADPPQINALASGKAAAIYDFGWQLGVIEADNPKLKGQIGAIAMPGTSADSALPTFLGGSNLAISAATKSPNNAYDYLKLLTGEKYQTQLFTEAKVIPNTNALLAKAAADPAIKPAADAAKNGWFPPNDPQWGEVESSQALQDMFVALLTGKKTPAEAGKAANEVITTTLNKK